MGFYYISLFSIFPLGIAYGALALLFWGIARLTRSMPRRKALLITVGAVFVVLPVGEELWIAWNFGQACKEAGTLIYKKVQVDGFYDDTTGWGPRQLAASKYQFVESNDILHRTLLRVERADQASKDRALAWYAEINAGKERPKDLFIVYPISDREEIVVSPNGIDAWRVTKLDHPTARYQYKIPRVHSTVSHKVTIIEKVVTDNQSNEVAARQLIYARRSPWYFISLDVPVKLCGDDLKGLLYDEVLKPRPLSKMGGLQ